VSRPTDAVNHILAERHYLGSIKRGQPWQNEHGIIVVASPTSRRIPQNWLELVRWCIVSTEKNAGSRQWSYFVRYLRKARPDVSTIVSYSDPSVGHTGALYRACNWLWAPTWLRLRPPPTGNGSWAGIEQQSVKDRWIFPLHDDPQRIAVLKCSDATILRKWPWLEYVEPGGVPFKRWISGFAGVGTNKAEKPS